MRILANWRAWLTASVLAASTTGCDALIGLSPVPADDDASLGPDGAGEVDGSLASDDGGDAPVHPTDGGPREPEGGMGTGCSTGGACTPADCQTGEYVCDDGGRVCSPTGHVADGMPCGPSASGVCSAGACSSCNAGGDCTDPSNPCVKKTIDCSSGQPVCKFAMNAPDGASCGSSQYCYSGVCSPCKVGNPCAPPNSPCHTGAVTSCAGGTMTCTDQNGSATAGTSCSTSGGASGVCDGQGTCDACTPNAPCTPTGKPCQQGTMSCATGPVCAAPSNINEGQPCGANLVCASGACVACGATSCPNGCCDSTGCVTTGQKTSECGKGGAACGACPANQICTIGGSGCTCPSSSPDYCGGACTNQQSDPKNCGACGNDCSALPHVSGPTTCNAGVCSVPATSCANGWMHCSSTANAGCETDISSPTTCGNCATTCPASAPHCAAAGSSYSCVTGCSGSTPTLCNGACVDTTSNSNYCGSCTVSCGGGMTCQSGQCKCPSGTLNCGGTCVDTTSDRNHCGSCTTSCVGSEICQGSACGCSGGLLDCSGSCQLASPQNKCGTACNTSCPQPSGATAVCARGTCSYACNGGLTNCTGGCFDTSSDTNHCGSCTTSCANTFDATVSCSGGSCVYTCNDGDPLSCSTPTQPACANWSFESGTEGWTLDTSALSTGATATLRTDSSRSTAGSHSLAVDLTLQPSSGGGGSFRIVVPLCPGGGMPDLTNKTLQYSAEVVNTSSASAGINSANGTPVTINGGTVTCDPSGIGFSPGNWATDIESCGAVSATTLGLAIGISFTSNPGFNGPWTATFYFDDVQVK